MARRRRGRSVLGYHLVELSTGEYAWAAWSYWSDDIQSNLGSSVCQFTTCFLCVVAKHCGRGWSGTTQYRGRLPYEHAFVLFRRLRPGAQNAALGTGFVLMWSARRWTLPFVDIMQSDRCLFLFSSAVVKRPFGLAELLSSFVVANLILFAHALHAGFTPP